MKLMEQKAVFSHLIGSLQKFLSFFKKKCNKLLS
jgi:hypothetical protein